MVEPGATEEPGLREWLRGLEGAGLRRGGVRHAR